MPSVCAILGCPAVYHLKWILSNWSFPLRKIQVRQIQFHKCAGPFREQKGVRGVTSNRRHSIILRLPPSIGILVFRCLRNTRYTLVFSDLLPCGPWFLWAKFPSSPLTPNGEIARTYQSSQNTRKYTENTLGSLKTKYWPFFRNF